MSNRLTPKTHRSVCCRSTAAVAGTLPSTAVYCSTPHQAKAATSNCCCCCCCCCCWCWCGCRVMVRVNDLTASRQSHHVSAPLTASYSILRSRPTAQRQGAVVKNEWPYITRCSSWNTFYGLRLMLSVHYTYRAKWRHSYLWSHYRLCVVGGQHVGVFCELWSEVDRWKLFELLFE